MALILSRSQVRRPVKILEESLVRLPSLSERQVEVLMQSLLRSFYPSELSLPIRFELLALRALRLVDLE